MPGKTIAPDQRILRRRAFGIVDHVLAARRAAHGDPEIHQIALQQPGFDAAIVRREARRLAAIGHASGHSARAQKRERGYDRPRRHYSAASALCPRAFAPALSSAISALARAIGLVR